MSRKNNLPGWRWYQSNIEELISNYISQSGIIDYQSLTGDATFLNVSVGAPTADDPRPKVVVFLSDIVDIPRKSNAVTVQHRAIGNKWLKQPNSYTHQLVFTLEIVSNIYNQVIDIAEVIKKGFKPHSTKTMVYEGKNILVPTEINNYGLSVEENGSQIINYVVSFTLAIEIEDEPLESWKISNTSNLDTIDLTLKTTFDELDDTSAEYNELDVDIT